MVGIDNLVSGSWYIFKDEKIGKGTEIIKKYLTNNLKIYNHLVP
ncbi:hypothetical protein [Candidatus Phytoplasma asteris]